LEIINGKKTFKLDERRALETYASIAGGKLHPHAFRNYTNMLVLSMHVTGGMHLKVQTSGGGKTQKTHVKDSPW
jgi:hypothetical protein